MIYKYHARLVCRQGISYFSLVKHISLLNSDWGACQLGALERVINKRIAKVGSVVHARAVVSAEVEPIIQALQTVAIMLGDNILSRVTAANHEEEGDPHLAREVHFNKYNN